MAIRRELREPFGSLHPLNIVGRPYRLEFRLGGPGNKWAISPEWSIRTGTDVIVKPKRSAKLDVLYRTGAAPLLSIVRPA